MKRVSCLAGLLLALLCASAQATLGQAADSTTTDSAKFQARLVKTSRANLTVHSMSSADGTVVNEYVNAQGVVFAVTWSGPWRPDLNQLLGTYYNDYLAQPTKRAGRQPVQVSRADLVIRTAGHARSFSGVAYLPAQMPAGVTPSELN
jgi:hypothetical protein